MPTFTHHHLTVERFTDDNGPAIMLTQQEGIEDSDTIVVHPWQLRAACEHLGLIASDQQSEKTIATMQRRMVLLRDRIGNLQLPGQPLRPQACRPFLRGDLCDRLYRYCR